MVETKKDYEPSGEQLDEAAKQAKELRDLFSQVSGPGYTATLWRVSPTWCEGYLEDFDVEPETGFDLGYICQKWGGRILNVKLKDSLGKFRKSATLKLKSWVPRHYGKIISQYDDFGDFDLPQGNAPGRNIRYKQQQQQQRHAPQQQQPTFDPNKLMEQMFSMFRDMSTQMKQPDRGLLDGAATVPADPMGQLMVSLKAYKEMQKIFGTGDQMIQQAAAAESDESNLFGPITQILGLMMNRQQPTIPQAQQGPPPPMLPNPATTIRNDLQGAQTNTQPQRSPDLPELIASLDPSQIGDIIISAASRMDQDKREKAFEEVASRLAGLDGVEYEDDDLTGEEDLIDDESSNTPLERDTD